MTTTTQFGTIKAAKDYLVGRIIAEADREDVLLSKVEREMLYFTEDGGLSKHLEQVNEQFEREYDGDEYESKIGLLVRNLQARNSREEQEMWDDAVLKLCEGDHYLIVLIDGGTARQNSIFTIPKGLHRWLPSLDSPERRPPGDLVRLVLAAFVAFIVGLVFIAFKVLIHR
jgi:hypothetical protein